MERGACLPCSASSDGVLIPELPSEVALEILVRLPHLVQARLRLVCRAWRDAMEPAAMSSLRKISEVWPVKLSSNAEVRPVKLSSNALWPVTVVDPLLHRTHEIPLPPQIRRHIYSFNLVVFNVIGHELLMAVMPDRLEHIELAGLYSFDGARMKWKDIKYSSLPPSLRGIRNVPPLVVRNSMCVAASASGDKSPQLVFCWGGYHGLGWQYSVERLDLKTKMWEPLPHPHIKRKVPAGVMLQGLFYMIGGIDVNLPHVINSGEIWDPVSRKWTLVPELWPSEVFGRTLAVSRVAVVRDRLYALSRRAFVSEELMYYETSSKLWISLGYVPLELYWEYRHCHLFGMDQELWVLTDGIFLASQPSLSQPLSWRTLACSKSILHDKWIGALLV